MNNAITKEIFEKTECNGYEVDTCFRGIRKVEKLSDKHYLVHVNANRGENNTLRTVMVPIVDSRGTGCMEGLTIRPLSCI